MTDPTPLELATFDELIGELRRRVQHLVVAATRITNGNDESEDFILNWYSGITSCIGLAERARDRLCVIANEKQREPREDSDIT